MNFIGNKNTVQQLYKWLERGVKDTQITISCDGCKFPSIVTVKPGDEYVTCPRCSNEIPIDRKGYVIIAGDSGNGKTYLPTIICKALDIDLFVVTPDDINSQEDVATVVKSINITSMFEVKKKRVVLVDDIDEISQKMSSLKIGRNFKDILDISKLSKYPVIFTTKSYKKRAGGKLFPSDFISNAMRLNLKRPLDSEMIPHLKERGLSDEQINRILEVSPSVRSIMLSASIGNVNELLEATQSNYAMVYSIGKRKLSVPIDRRNIKTIFSSIQFRSDTSINDMVAVMERFADFDYRTRSKFQEIDPWIVNHLPERLESVMFKFRYKKKPDIAVKDLVNLGAVYRKQKKKRVVPLKQPSLDSFL